MRGSIKTKRLFLISGSFFYQQEMVLPVLLIEETTSLKKLFPVSRRRFFADPSQSDSLKWRPFRPSTFF